MTWKLRMSFCFLVAVVPGTMSEKAEQYGSPPPSIDQYIQRLIAAYPDHIAGRDGEFLVMKNGARFPISDGRTDKTFSELIEHPDVDDMFYRNYPPPDAPIAAPPKDSDPGRVRYEPLFLAMYGDCKKEDIQKSFREIAWLPSHGRHKVEMTTVNGVDKALEQVSFELDNLPMSMIKYVIPTSGTYNCRRVEASGVKSMHSYGAAIDINTKYADYWRWAAKNQPLHWSNKIPPKVVEIFRKHGFIWGGYWYHFDTMHFEYRPELLSAIAAPPESPVPPNLSDIHRN